MKVGDEYDNDDDDDYDAAADDDDDDEWWLMINKEKVQIEVLAWLPCFTPGQFWQSPPAMQQSAWAMQQYGPIPRCANRAMHTRLYTIGTAQIQACLPAMGNWVW